MSRRSAHRLSTLRVLLAGGLALAMAQTLVSTGASAVAPPGVAASSPAPAPKAPPLLPNLVVLPASDVHVQRVGRERRLRFESGLGNIGRGPIEVRPNRNQPCPDGQHHATQVMYRDTDGNGWFRRDTDTGLARRSAGCMIFHPAHDHWHFEAASRYRLFRADRPTIAKVAQRKMSFCLRDSERVPEQYRTPKYPEHYGRCSRHSPQGISVGWVDVYESFLAGQAIRLRPRMGDGLYCLHITVDPLDALRESNDEDNTSVRAIYLRGDKVSYRDNNGRCQRLTS